jgi:isoquinoline 1-oxidoreductase beta subunit
VPYDFGLEAQLLSDVFLDVPARGWRSIYAGHTATINEIMVDEISRDLHQDAVAFRRQKLTSARAVAVLDKVASVGRWDRAMAAGTAQGVAIHEESRGDVAFLVEIDCRDPVSPRVTKGVCALDGGGTGNPRGLGAELEGALIEALWATLPAPVRIDKGDGRDEPRCCRTRHSRPAMEVCVMVPTGQPGDAAELAHPAAAAAVANAYARATGTTPCHFPIAG